MTFTAYLAKICPSKLGGLSLKNLTMILVVLAFIAIGCSAPTNHPDQPTVSSKNSPPATQLVVDTSSKDIEPAEDEGKPADDSVSSDTKSNKSALKEMQDTTEQIVVLSKQHEKDDPLKDVRVNLGDLPGTTWGRNIAGAFLHESTARLTYDSIAFDSDGFYHWEGALIGTKFACRGIYTVQGNNVEMVDTDWIKGGESLRKLHFSQRVFAIESVGDIGRTLRLTPDISYVEGMRYDFAAKPPGYFDAKGNRLTLGKDGTVVRASGTR